jgi:hypothetical protein
MSQLISPETVNHLMEAAKLVGPFIAVITTLIIWAWNKIEKAQDKIEAALTLHIKDDDSLHDQLFSHQRETEARLNVLIGEHNVRHS